MAAAGPSSALVRLTFEAIGKAIERDEVWIAAAFYGQFGDGIQSMIDCQVTVDKKEDPKGDRVVLTFE
ncbi:hypothetical protein PHLCEN_2v9994 [Hermanssonia centrifuga]|uniref:Cyanate lyase C-terminal domain-containing protein n=1 Tax=Hermanssonia centrifuga TaxID=98765 RepID=A0A2R6NP79_9APHY|nr:hypothetical protein PHLCEN_2v9994 [Hermanssonia centrifuga]